jgi:hypothetical protein
VPKSRPLARPAAASSLAIVDCIDVMSPRRKSSGYPTLGVLSALQPSPTTTPILQYRGSLSNRVRLARSHSPSRRPTGGPHSMKATQSVDRERPPRLGRHEAGMPDDWSRCAAADGPAFQLDRVEAHTPRRQRPGHIARREPGTPVSARPRGTRTSGRRNQQYSRRGRLRFPGQPVETPHPHPESRRIRHRSRPNNSVTHGIPEAVLRARGEAQCS